MWSTVIKRHLILLFMVQRIENSTGGKCIGSRLLRSCEDKSQGIFPGYVEKSNERVAGVETPVPLVVSISLNNL